MQSRRLKRVEQLLEEGILDRRFASHLVGMGVVLVVVLDGSGASIVDRP